MSDSGPTVVRQWSDRSDRSDRSDSQGSGSRAMKRAAAAPGAEAHQQASSSNVRMIFAELF